MLKWRYEVVNWLRATQDIIGKDRKNTGVSGLLTFTKSIKPSSLYEWMELYQPVSIKLLELIEKLGKKKEK